MQEQDSQEEVVVVFLAMEPQRFHGECLEAVHHGVEEEDVVFGVHPADSHGTTEEAWGEKEEVWAIITNLHSD